MNSGVSCASLATSRDKTWSSITDLPTEGLIDSRSLRRSCVKGTIARRERAVFTFKEGRMGSVVVSLALEKRLFLNVRRKRLLVSPFGKKRCDINERLNPF